MKKERVGGAGGGEGDFVLITPGIAMSLQRAACVPRKRGAHMPGVSSPWRTGAQNPLLPCRPRLHVPFSLFASLAASVRGDWFGSLRIAEDWARFASRTLGSLRIANTKLASHREHWDCFASRD